MSRWFRWYEGTSEDGKFRAVARNAKVTVATVMGVWAILLEDASHPEHRGVATRGEDFWGAVLGLDDADLIAILSAMEGMELISVGHGAITITKWKERQFETDTTDATNAERQRRFREKHKQTGNETPRNGSVTAEKRPDTDTDTDSENRKSSPVGDWAALEAKLRKAAGWENEPHPGLCVIGPIVGLIEAGASLELDILPVVAARAPKVRARAWTYFVGPVQDAMAARLGAAIPQSRAPPDSEFRRKSADAELQRLSDETGWKPGKKATASTPAIS